MTPVDVTTRTEPGFDARVNEDVATVVDGAAWVIDGATSLGDRTVTGRTTDGEWLSDRFDSLLRERVHDDATLTDIVRRCTEAVREEFAGHVGGGEIPEESKPSGAIALARWDGETVSYLVLGDCSVVLAGPEGTEAVLGEGPREYDEQVVERMATLIRDQGYDYEEAWEAVQPDLRSNRRMKNQPDGYWTLGFDPASVDHAVTGRHRLAATTAGLLFTDGFEHLATTYDVFADWDTLASYVCRNGLERAFTVLRAVERSDPECERYPRLKPSDDASAVALCRE